MCYIGHILSSLVKGKELSSISWYLTNCWCWVKDYSAFFKFQVSRVSKRSFVNPFFISSSDQNLQTCQRSNTEHIGGAATFSTESASSLYAWTPGNEMFLTIAVFRYAVVLKKQKKQLCKARCISRWLQTEQGPDSPLTPSTNGFVFWGSVQPLVKWQLLYWLKHMTPDNEQNVPDTADEEFGRKISLVA